MEIPQIVAFLIIIAIGSYIQTISGFALGLIAMGGIAMFNLAPIDFSANVISIVAIVNIAIALYKKHEQINRRIVMLSCIGIVPLTGVGLSLLNYLTKHQHELAALLLGAVILITCTALILASSPKKVESKNYTHLISGGLGGLVSGLFGAGGPPLVIHLYRQPVDFYILRSTLLATIAILPVTRIAYTFGYDQLNSNVLILSSFCIPASIAATVVARLYRPKVSDLTIKRFTYGLLCLLGLSLIITNFKALEILQT